MLRARQSTEKYDGVDEVPIQRKCKHGNRTGGSERDSTGVG